MKAGVPATPARDRRFEGVSRATEAGVSPPAPKKPISVAYPRSAMDSAVCGTVSVEALVGADGKVKAARVVESLGQGAGVDEDAVKNVLSWQLAPAMYDGKTVPVVMVMKVHYFVDAVVVPPDLAGYNIGKFATICGQLAAVPSASGADLFEFAGSGEPARVRFAIPATGLVRVPSEPGSPALCVTGPIEKVDARARITVRRADQVRVDTWPSDAVNAGGVGVSRPTLLQKVNAKYTSQALQAKIQGEVELEVVVMPSGAVGAVRVTKSLDPTFGLDTQAVNAARGWRFLPGMKDGHVVPVILKLVIEFRLH